MGDLRFKQGDEDQGEEEQRGHDYLIDLDIPACREDPPARDISEVDWQ